MKTISLFKQKRMVYDNMPSPEKPGQESTAPDYGQLNESIKPPEVLPPTEKAQDKPLVVDVNPGTFMEAHEEKRAEVMNAAETKLDKLKKEVASASPK